MAARITSPVDDTLPPTTNFTRSVSSMRPAKYSGCFTSSAACSRVIPFALRFSKSKPVNSSCHALAPGSATPMPVRARALSAASLPIAAADPTSTGCAIFRSRKTTAAFSTRTSSASGRATLKPRVAALPRISWMNALLLISRIQESGLGSQ